MDGLGTLISAISKTEKTGVFAKSVGILEGFSRSKTGAAVWLRLVCPATSKPVAVADCGDSGAGSGRVQQRDSSGTAPGMWQEERGNGSGKRRGHDSSKPEDPRLTADVYRLTRPPFARLSPRMPLGCANFSGGRVSPAPQRQQGTAAVKQRALERRQPVEAVPQDGSNLCLFVFICG